MRKTVKDRQATMNTESTIISIIRTEFKLPFFFGADVWSSEVVRIEIPSKEFSISKKRVAIHNASCILIYRCIKAYLGYFVKTSIYRGGYFKWLSTGLTIILVLGVSFIVLCCQEPTGDFNLKTLFFIHIPVEKADSTNL